MTPSRNPSGGSAAGRGQPGPAGTAPHDGRNRTGANFYAETVDLEVALGANSQARVLQDGQWHSGLFLSPHHFDLPTALLTPEGTRRF